MSNILAEILTIGDEILYGQIVDTNSQWISAELDKMGIKTIRKTTVPDKESEILKAFSEAQSRAQIILITGGLGPTNDDLTKPCLAKFFDSELQMNEKALSELTKLFASIGRELTDLNREQANLPVKSQAITNRVGTAPGMWFYEEGKVFVSMPGVPHEMKTMMMEQIIPRLHDLFDTPIIFHQLIKTVGIGESWLAEKIQPWEESLPENIRLAYLPGLGEVKLRLTATGPELPPLKKQVEEQIDQLRTYAGKYIYGFGKDTLPKAVGEMLKSRNLTIGCAESCSGGAVASAITSVPGSSQYFQGSVVAYHNQLKSSILEVNEQTLQQHGAVSEATVLEMARGAQKALNAHIGVATSGIAGPDGGTPEKPVGTIWVAVVYGDQATAKKLSLFKDREINIKFTVMAVLNMVRQRLLEMDGEK